MNGVAAAFEPTDGKVELFLAKAVITDCEVLYAISDETSTWGRHLPRAMQVDADMISFVDAIFVNTDKIAQYAQDISALIARCKPKYVVLHPDYSQFLRIPAIAELEYTSLWNYNGWKSVLCLS